MFDTNEIVRALEIICSSTLITTCVFTNLISSYCICAMESCHDLLSTHVNLAFPRIVAIVCMISRFKMIFHSAKDGFHKYEDKIKGYKIHFPNSALEMNAYRMFALFIVSTYASVVLPINMVRIYNIYYEARENAVIVFYTLMYIQNWSICSIEVHFITHCFGLYQKFYQINEEMSMLKSETIITNKYPSVLQCAGQRNCNCTNNPSKCAVPTPIRINVECRTIELIRMKHQFVREVMNDLNRLYGFQLALSICALCVMIIVDVYCEIIASESRAKSKILFYGWILQYFFRFFSIVMVTHHTTKQVCFINFITLFVHNNSII